MKFRCKLTELSIFFYYKMHLIYVPLYNIHVASSYSVCFIFALLLLSYLHQSVK